MRFFHLVNLLYDFYYEISRMTWWSESSTIIHLKRFVCDFFTLWFKFISLNNYTSKRKKKFLFYSKLFILFKNYLLFPKYFLWLHHFRSMDLKLIQIICVVCKCIQLSHIYYLAVVCFFLKLSNFQGIMVSQFFHIDYYGIWWLAYGQPQHVWWMLGGLKI